MQRINGSELSCYKTTAIQLGVAKKENKQHKKPRFAVLFVRNKMASITCKTRRILLFEDEYPGLIDILAKYKSDTADKNGRFTVKIQDLKNSPDAAEVEDLWEFQGMKTEQYKLKKGLCYMNDVDGNRVTRNDGSAVMVDTITVLVQVQFILEDNGKLKTTYVDGYDPDTQGQKMENSFYKEAVNTAPASTDTEAEQNEETPF